MRLAAAAGLSVLLCGCGYMGDPKPPALNRPVRVEDLAAVERGANIVVQFTVPKTTTEGLQLKRTDIELRIGPAPSPPFTTEKWLPTSDRIPVPVDNQTVAHVEIPAQKYYNQTEYIAVNVHGPGGRSVGWSRYAIVPVVPALPTPEDVQAKDAPDAVQLTWRAAAPEFRIFRKLVPETDWTRIATSTTPSYTDATIEYGMTYQYQIQSDQKTGDTYAESELSDVSTIKPKDTFPPAAPTNLTAVPGARSIELVWNRNTEKDFASYRLFRDGKQIADGLTAPTYSDRDVKPQVRYQYQVSAIDTAGNESQRSATIEATIQ